MNPITPKARKVLTPALTALAFATAATVAFAQSTPSLESLLGTKSYQATGLNKLTAAEQAELVRLLQARGIRSGEASDATALAADDESNPALRASLLEAQRARENLATEVAAARAATEQMRQQQDALMAAAKDAEMRREAAERAAREASGDEFESRLKEPFTGWSGRTLFHLENGQVWRQRLRDRYVHMAGDLPRIRITRNFMGYYEMELLGYERKIGVSRMR